MKKPKTGKSLRSSMRKAVWSCDPLKRVNYFTGQLLTADDLRAEQNYHLGKHRRHNRLCHGPGVVQGLNVSVAKENGGRTVIVSPGVAIDSAGNEIQLCAAVRLGLRESATPMYVVIRFRECPTDPVPVPGEAGSDPGASEQFSRIQEECEVLLSPKVDPADAGPECQEERCLPPVLVLARLVHRGRNWHVDRKFKTPRAN